jgi:hypothetical protein
LKLTNQNICSETGTYNGLNIFAQDYHSDDDVLAISDSDSDILVSVEKADIVEFLDDKIAQHWLGLKKS